MHALDRKLVRDLWRLRGQVLAIGLVIASGVGMLVMSLSTLESLRDTSSTYYERYRFADVFSGLERAPIRLKSRIADIPGVQTVQTRIVKIAVLDIEGFEEPIIGQLVSIPEQGEPLLNQLALREGRLVSPGHVDEVVISEPFADAHNLRVGDHLKAIMNANKRTLDVVGIALAPEFVYAIGPGALMPDDKRFGILWMGRKALASAYDLDGAFNDVSLSLLVNTEPENVIQQLNQLTKDYGSIGAIARKDQISNWFLMNEINQLRTMSMLLPTIFLTVAAFLTQMVLSRLIATERSEIGLLKAFGYTRLQVARHYARMVLAIAAIGILLGWILGTWLGRYQTEIYAELYRFPFLYFKPSFSTFTISALVSIAAALLGSMRTVYSAATLPPAEAMLPPSPPVYKQRKNIVTQLLAWLDQPTRIIFRQLARWPIRSMLTSIGVAFAIAVLVMSLSWFDSIRQIIDVYFFDAQRQDITIGLTHPQGNEVAYEINALPGVLSVEPSRIVSTEFYASNRTHRGTIQGVLSSAILNPVYDVERGIVPIYSDGLSLNSMLADKLNVNVGDSIRVKILEERRPDFVVPVVDIFESYIGMPAYMNLHSLNRIMKEGKQVEFLNLLVDEKYESKLFSELKEIPDVAAVSLRQAAVDTFNTTMAETLIIFVTIFSVFGCALAFGLVYNSTRITLSERGRELATLRVLGFTKAEISYILLGEIGLLIVVSLPVGCLLGYNLAWIIVSAFETELYRIPLVIHPSTYGKAIIIALVATIFSALLVRNKLNRLNLIKVLKTRE
ncbi:MAG: FtsX-like permease family protein [Gammaproteobacteria bacterium]